MSRLHSIIILCAAAVLALPAGAQVHSIYGSIVGTATDQTGAVIPGVAITVTNVETNIAATTKADDQGRYRIERLIAGAYRVRAEQPTFKTFVRDGVTLSEAATVRVNVMLEVGQVTERIEVVEQTPLIETESPQISSIMTWADRKFLPTRDVSFYSTLGLYPGAVTASPGFYVSFAGSRTTQYDYSIDGQTFRSPYAGHNALVANFNEWQAEQKASYVNSSAEYSQLATVNAATKSGTNAFHGSAVWYYTSGGLQGRNPFSPARPSGVTHRYATSLGGPIKRNRAFFFAAYSGSRDHRAVNVNSTVPTALMRQGNFGEIPTDIIDPSAGVPFANKIIPASRISAAATAFNERFYPLPNYGGPGFQNLNYRTTVKQAPAADDLFVRVDYRFSDRHSLFVRDSFDEGNRGGLFTGSLPTVGYRQGYRRDQNAVLSDVYSFRPNLYNEFSIGYTRDFNLILPSTSYGPDQSKLQVPAFPLPAMPEMRIAGFTTVTQQDFQMIPEDIVTVRDNVSWMSGRHRLKAGVLWTRGLAAQAPISGSRVYGLFTFNNTFASRYAMSDFLLGLPVSQYRIDPSSYFKLVYRQRATAAAFVQDDIQIGHTLTLNLGLRYEWGQPWKEKNYRQNTWDPTTGAIVVPNQQSISLMNPELVRDYKSLIVTADQAGYPARMINISALNFGPRIGLAWRPLGDTVVRAGYGIYYDFNPPTTQAAVDPYIAPMNYPTNRLTAGVPTYQFPAPFATVNPAAGVGIFTLNTVGARDIRMPYSQQWNLTAERQFFGNTGLRLSYVATRGVQGLFFYNRNLPPFSTTPKSQADRPYPRYGAIGFSQNGSGHFYNALQAEVTHRSRRGLYFDSHWTWAKDVGESEAAGLYGDSISNPFDRSYNRGNTTYIPHHRWVNLFNWQVPVGSGKSFFANMPGALDRLFGGWQATGILTFSTGRWLTPGYCGYDPVGSPGGTFNCGRPDRIKDGNLPSGQGTKDMWFDLSAFTLPGASPSAPLRPPAAPIGRLGNSGRSILEGPGFWQFDFGLIKGFPMFKERLRANLAMLGTNIFNHPNLGDPATDITTPATAGKIFGIYGDSNTGGIGMRQVQLSLRLEF